RVFAAADGPHGVALALGHQPEVVLIDLGLPGLDGYEVARAVRASPVGKAALLIAVTGYGQAEDRRRPARAGFHCQLVEAGAPRVGPSRRSERVAPGTRKERRATLAARRPAAARSMICRRCRPANGVRLIATVVGTSPQKVPRHTSTVRDSSAMCRAPLLVKAAGSIRRYRARSTT